MNKRLILIAVSVGLILLLLYFTFYDPKKGNRISVVGNYESLSPTLIEKAKFALAGIECFYSGRQLKLLADSSFTLIDNTNILTGKWNQQSDLIDLHFLSKIFVGDSLDKKIEKPEVPLADITLKYSNPDLYIFLTNSNGNCVEIFKIKS